MKSIKLFVLIISLFCTNQVIGQSGLNFQGVARNENGVILASQEMSLRLSIVQGSATGSVEFSEVRKTTTNAQGLFSVVIGGSNAVSTLGNFNAIDWKLAPKFLKIEMDVTGGENFTVIGTTQLQSAAYAKFAESADATNLNGVVPISKGGTGTTTGVTKAMIGLENVDNTSDLSKPISTSTQSALDLKASLIQLNSKEDASNKSTNVLTDAASDTKFPSVKSVKTYVDNAIQSGVPDATTALKGKIILAGALTGTADLPEIATNAIGTNQLLDASVSDAKIIAISGTKVIGNIDGNASNITGVVSIANGGTGANNANDARANLGLTIGTNVESPLTVASPLTRVSNTIGMSVASSGVNGYLSSTDWTNFNSKINASEKAANNGVATLGANGKIPSDQIPAISFQSANVVASQSAMLALNSAVEGSIAIRTDNNKNYVLSTTPASTLSNWIELATPSAVTSVNGAAGPNVVLTTDNIAEGSTNKYYSNTQVRNAIGVTAPLTYDASTGGIALPRASMNQAGYLDYTDWIAFDSKMGTASATATFVPYTGATGPVNLGNYDLTVNRMTIGTGKNKSNKNSAFGTSALYNSTTGSFNSAFGYYTLVMNTTGFSNAAFGIYALEKNTEGYANAAFGAGAMSQNTLGIYNTSIGSSTLSTLTTGSYNTAIGSSSNVSDGTLTNSTAIGYGALVNASNTIQLGNGNITDVKTVGKLTTGVITYPNIDGISGQVLSTTGSGTLTWTTPGLNFVDLSSNQTIAGTKTFNSDGSFNGVIIGRGGGSSSLNTALGAFALMRNTNGLQNTAIGYGALQNNLTGNSNTVLGAAVLSQANSGSGNTGIGASVMQYTTGNNNTALGYQSLFNTTTGNNNVAVGDNTGLENTTGSNNILIGSNSNVATNNLSNAIALGSGTTVNASNTIQLGNTDITDVKTVGKLTTGAVTYPNIDGLSGQILTSTGAGTLTWTTPTTTDLSNITGVLSISRGGTGTSTQNFVDLSADQTINGNKTFSSGLLTVGLSNRGSSTSSIVFPQADDPAFISHNVVNNVGTMRFSAGDDGTVDYFAFGYGVQNAFTEKLKIYADGQLFAPVDAKINGLVIGMGKNNLYGNTALGNTTLASVTTGQYNTAIGNTALKFNTTGGANTAIGNEAMVNNTSGVRNIAIGSSTLIANTTGVENTVVGTSAMYVNTTGSANAVIGYHSLNSNTTGSNNIAIGNDALYGNVAGSGAVAIGTGAMRNANNTVTSHFSFNTAIGYDALRGSNILANNTGTNNTAIGAYTLTNNSTGFMNVAIGSSTLTNNTTGELNIAIGAQALQTNTTGAYNVGIGQAALTRNTTGIYNTANGTQALFSNTTGTQNNAYGSYALIFNTTGNFNNAIGYTTLNDNISGSNNTAIGNNTGRGIINGNNNTILGANVTGLADVSNHIILANGTGAIKARHDGNDWSFTGSVAIGTASPTSSAALEVNSTTKGFLPPRMTTTQRDAIASPAEGLIIFNTNTKGIELYNGSFWTSTAHYIGESYGGGTIFYLYDNGQHGLIAATADQAVNIRWNAGTNSNTIALADGLGAGKKNTATIIASQGFGDGQTYAARACNEYSVTSGGVTYGDWYLPSKYELNLLREAKFVVGNFAGFFYWSSTEINQSTAWGQYFDLTTTQSAGDKVSYDTNRVRAIRSF